MDKQNTTATSPPKNNGSVDKRKAWVEIAVDPSSYELLRRTADRNHISIRSLTELCAESVLGSLKNYGLKVPTIDSKAPNGTIKGKSVQVTVKTHNRLNSVCAYLGCGISNLMRDAIMAQRFNFQRLQPVNARSMSSIRMELFKLEQGGVH